MQVRTSRRFRGSRIAAISFILLSSTALAQAQNSTWLGITGPPGNWNDPGNWTPAGPPAGPTGNAVFNSSPAANTSVDFAFGSLAFGGMTFTAAPAYTFTSAAGGTIVMLGNGVVVDNASAAPIFNLNGSLMGFANSATLGRSIVNLSGNATLTFINTSNAGSAVITNTLGAINFNESSNAGTATIFNAAGNLVWFNQFAVPLMSASAGNAQIDNSGSVAFGNQSTAGNATIITRAGAGTFFLTSASAGSSNQIVQANGNLQFDNGSTAGSSTIDNSSNGGGLGGVRFLMNSNAGSANIINRVGATTFFRDNSSASSATIVNSGVLGFVQNSTAGNATIITQAGGATFFQDSSTGGSASLVINGGPISNGSVNVGPGAGAFTIGSLAGTTPAGGIAGLLVLAGARDLVVGSNNQSTTYDGNFVTAGSFTKIGTGTLTLSRFAAHQGATNINAGTLHLNGGQISQTTSILVAAGATLSGVGTAGFGAGVTSTTVNGTLAPGNPGGALVLNSTLQLNPSATYRTTFSSSSGQFSQAVVQGAATLGGTLSVNSSTAALNFNTPYTVLSSTQLLAGQFQSTVWNVPVTLTPTLSYAPFAVQVSFAPNLGGAAAAGGTNQQNVGAALQAGLAGASSPSAFLPLFNMNQAQYLDALSQLSGEIATGASTHGFQVMNSFMSVMLDPTIGSRSAGGMAGPALGFDMEDSAANAYAAKGASPVVRKASPAFAQFRPRPAPVSTTTAWATGYGNWTTTDGDAAAASSQIQSRYGGLAAGMDYRPVAGTVFGFAIGGSDGTYSLSNGLGNGKATAFQAGAYGSVSSSNAYASFAFAYGRHSVDTSRNVAIAPGDTISASFDPYSISGRGELGARYSMQQIGITPFVALQGQRYVAPAYQETAGGAAAGLALSVNQATTDQFRSELGVWFDFRALAGGPQNVNLRARVAWAHQYGDQPTTTSTFAAFPATPFNIVGATPDRDSVLVSTLAEWSVQRNVNLSLRFDGDLSRNNTSYGGQAGVRFFW